MLQLVEFISRNKSFIVFILLEVLCFRLLIHSNSYWGATYFNTSNFYVARILGFSNGVREYLHLRDVNKRLAEENVQLNEQITYLQQLSPAKAPAEYRPDSAFAQRYRFTVAKVVDMQLHQANNYLTIDKGTADGLAPGMGVISASGIVGKVQVCSEHMSVVTSILHSRFMVSTQLLRSDEIGPAQWDGKHTNEILLTDISRYKPVSVGDTAVTSGYNAVFPPGVMVGTVNAISTPSNQTSYTITLQLATDFKTLSYVYVVHNQVRPDLEELHKKIDP